MAKSGSEQPPQKLTVPEALAKLRIIRQGLETLVEDFHSNIEALSDDSDFLDRMENLQRDADQRVSILEKEVKRLRSDVKSIKDLLGEDAEENSTDPN